MSDRSNPDVFVSVVGVFENAEKCLEPFVRDVAKILSQTYSDYEIVLIDNDSNDGTISIAERLLEEIPSIRLIKLSLRVASDIAFAAGLENAIGDIIVLTIPGVDPPECITPLVRQCYDGDDVVVGTSKDLPQSLAYRFLHRYAQRLMQSVLKYSSPPDATHLRCLSRRAANTVFQTSAFHQRLNVRIFRTGYRTGTFEYRLDAKRLQGTRTIFDGLQRGMQMLVFNSTLPLRIVNGLGILGSFLALFFSVFSVLVRLFKEKVVEGWATLVVMNSMLFFLLFIVLSFFGEYLRRLLEDQGNHKQYSVLFEKNSSVMVNENRFNVLNESDESHPSAVQTGRDR